MNVKDTVEALIKNWPTLYENRVDALLHVFSHYDTVWANGELVLPDEDIGKSARDYSKDNHWDLPGEEDLHTTLWKSKENALITWRIENAGLIAQNTVLCHLTRSDAEVYMARNHFADMPEDVTEDWFGAAKELAREIMRKTEGATGHGKNARKDTMVFLNKHKLLNTEVRDRRIAELRAELAALGGYWSPKIEGADDVSE